MTHAAATIPSTPITRMLQQAHAAGCPRDQVERFMAAGYIPTPKQWKFHAAARQADIEGYPDDIAVGGARGGAKTHGIFAQIALDDCVRMPGLKALYLRKVGKAARESLQALCTKTLGRTNYRPNWQEGIIRLLDYDSVIVAGHFQTEKDIEIYLGQEYDLVAIEERTQLSQAKLDMIYGSVRSSKRGWRPRKYSSTNPGGVGHTDFKKTFILPWREKREQYTRFIPMGYKDNPFLDAGYIRYLESLTGILGRMWRDGDWDVGSGQYFVHWDVEHHTMSTWPYFPLPPQYPCWAGFDYGWSHPTSVHFFTQIGEMVYTLAEHVQSYWLPQQHAAALEIIARKLGRPLDRLLFHAGHDVFAKDHRGVTIADEYAKHGIRLVPANTNREQGAAAMLNRLGNPEAGQAPTWLIYHDCPRLIETIPGLMTDHRRATDVIKVDAGEDGEGGDDPYDSARYGLMAAAKPEGNKPVSVNIKARPIKRR